MSGVARARVAVSRPGREDEQQAGGAARADLVALAGIEHGEEARPAAHRLVVAHDLDLALDDDEVGALVDLVIL